jgi:predicted Rossmann fold nucleotide-binding protein DprA/Smf involved in DNA uptake
MPDLLQIQRESPGYPAAVERFLGDAAPDPIHCLGNPDLLDRPMTALFASARAPGTVLNATFDLAQHLRATERQVVSGFHSPLEREVLAILLRSQLPILLCPARGLDHLRIPSDCRHAFNHGRLAFASPFPEKIRRATRDLARTRNQFAAALADNAWITHAAPGGSLHSLARDILSQGRPLFTLDDPANQPLLQLGATCPSP